MAYKTSELKKQALAAIENHRLFFVEDVVSYLPCHKATFYEHFPDGSDNLKEIHEALQKNRIEVKSSMRSKWYNSDAPALQLALYKIICSPEERRSLSMQHTEHSGKIDFDRELIIKSAD